jgi:hypothetical protein
MHQSQRRAMILVVAIGVLALPAYLIVGIVTVPLGLGMLMLMSSSPWILNLYPFLFAGTGNGFTQTHYIDSAIGLPLTVAQWGVIAWLTGIVARGREPHLVPYYAVGIVLAFGVATAAVLSLLGIGLVMQAAHT